MTAARSLSFPPPLMSVHKPESDPAPQPFPFFQVLRYFKAYCRETPEVKAVHRSLFYYLLELVEQRGVARVKLDRASAMDGAGIGSKDTYTAALKQLHAWGLVCYTPGKNGERAAIVELLPKSSVPETGHSLGRYWDAAQDTEGDAAGTTKELLDFKTLTSEREARALAEKKIGQLENQLRQLQAQASASRTGGGAAAPAEVLVPLAAEDDEYQDRPRDVQMVDDFLANHHDPRVRQHAGKGHLFWAEYASKGWVRGRFNTPITNWRALIPAFKFHEPTNALPGGPSQARPATSTTPAPATGTFGSFRKPG